MKSKTLKKRATANKNNVRRFSSALRTARRGSAYAFVAGLGVWLPRGEAATLINLDATGLSPGPLATWVNTGTTAGNFTSDGNVTPEVTTIDGVRCVGLTNAANVGAGNLGTHYLGPPTGAAVSNGLPKTVEAWIYDPG